MGFAYSPQMQIILLVLTFFSTFLCCYYATGLVLLLNEEQTSFKRRIACAALYSLIFEIIVLSLAFSGILYMLPYKAQVIFTINNPVFMLFFFYMLAKVLRLSMYRAMHTAIEIYIYADITRLLGRIIADTFFRQTSEHFNYLTNACSVLCYITLTTVTFYIIRYLLKRFKFVVKYHENPPGKPFKLQIFNVFVIFSLIYIVSAVIPALTPEYGILHYFLTLVILVLSLLFYVLRQAYIAQNESFRNKEVHIGTLTKINDESRALRHDFNNILQTFSGYLELGDLDTLREYHSMHESKARNVNEQFALSQRMDECPELISLLISKIDYADNMTVSFDIKMPSGVYIKNISPSDLCRCLSSLLDNAIEAAAISLLRRASFFLDSKPDGSQLFIISNSTESIVNTDEFLTPGYTTKDYHSGAGVPDVRKILDKYMKASLRFSCYQQEVNAYLEIRP